MRGVQEPSTSATLIGRLRLCPTDEAAWAKFAERYGPKILAWCRRWGLQEADALEVGQDVLLKLAQKMQSFVYNPSRSFRAWLKTLAHHAWRDFAESQQRAVQGSGGSRDAALAAVEARDDLSERLAEEFDLELLEMAMARVRLRVEANTWEAFRLTALEGLSPVEVAPRVAMQVASVYAAKSKVHRMIRDAIQKLDSSTPAAEGGQG